MLMAMDRPIETAPAAPSAEPTDDELMMAVAESRQVAAFEQLYRRHERAAYNLALHLTGSKAMAEEAVQDAALRIWRMAEKFRPDGSFKGWFFTTVVNCSKKHRQGRWRDQLRSERLAVLPPTRERKGTENGVEDQELSRALHSEMERLEPLDRSLLVLYFGAGLNQREIGRVLEVPQTTVSMKIREAVGRLRAGLTSAGFAAAVPVLEASNWGDAVLGGDPVPPDLHGRVMLRLSSTAQNSARAAIAKGFAGPWLAATACLAIAGIGWWAYTSPMTVQPSEAKPLPIVVEKLKEVGKDGSAPPAFVPRTLLALDFNDEAEFMPQVRKQNGFRWSKDGGIVGSPCLVSEKTENFLILDIGEDAYPLIVTVQQRKERPREGDPAVYSLSCFWPDFEECAVFYNFGKYMYVSERKMSRFGKVTVCISAEFCHGTEDSSGAETLFWSQRKPGTQLGILVRGRQRIDNLTVRTAAPSEVPDFDAYRKAIEAVPIGLRDERVVPLPQLPTSRKGRPVEVIFYKSLFAGAE